MSLPPMISRALVEQSGVVARRQVLAAGWSKSDIDRMVRRREWVRLLPGVYVDHTGTPTWLQRAWCGVLHYAPAALARESALRVTAGPGWRLHDDRGPITVAVAASRNVSVQPGYRVRWLSSFDDQVLTHLHPPRVRFEEACLEAVIGRAPLEQVQMLAAACQSRRTTALRLSQTLAVRRRFPQRAWVEGVLRDIESGTCSVLEHGFLTKVERPHALPTPRRQRAEVTDSGQVYRDASYVVLGLEVELDGRLFHDTPEQRDTDLERDLDSALLGSRTIRLGWGQVFGRPCATAAKLARLLAGRGWTGTARRCEPRCAVGSTAA